MELTPIINQKIEIMNNLIYTGIVEDIRYDKCSDSETQQLLGVFRKAIRYFTDELFEKSWENLSDFFELENSEVSKFSLKMHKKKKGKKFQYIGEFRSDLKNLKIYAKSNI